VITIKDIALALGISHSTVSRALNNSSSVKEDTKKKVFAMAKELNYTPNESARSLKLAKSQNIGVFFSSISVGTSPSLIYKVTTKTNKLLGSKYNIVIKGIDTYMKHYSSVNKQNFKGIIVVSQRSDDDEFIKQVLENDIPLVVINRKVENMVVNNLYADDSKGAFLAIHHLFNYGHKKIDLIQGVDDFISTDLRKRGVTEAITQFGITINRVENGDYSYMSGYEAMKRILESKNMGTALFAFNDDMAIGAMRACFDNNISLPSDYGIIGFDNDQKAQFSFPSLTTINRPVGKIACRAAEILLAEINEETKVNDEIIFEDRLAIRDSVEKL
jgi:DNA-binding LacI/PurR family transcriptional regulator